MSFVRMRDNLIAHFNQITKDVDNIFEVAVDKDETWNLYLDSFPEGTNNIYRERREHDCSCRRLCLFLPRNRNRNFRTSQ